MKIFDGPDGQYVDELDHLKVGDRIVFPAVHDPLHPPDRMATVTDLVIRADGVHVGMYDGDNGSAGFFLIRDGEPRKQEPQTPRPTPEERRENNARAWRGRSLDEWVR